jgi:pimeloyl-ACP methyl ester carboxylesterase
MARFGIGSVAVSIGVALIVGCGKSAPNAKPAGCVTDVSAGLHTFTCEGLDTQIFVPSQCEAPGCGLILELHGDTGTGPLFEANMGLMPLGNLNGYIVIAPTGPPLAGQVGSTWTLAEDDTLMSIVDTVAGVFGTDAAKTHVTGFSRGGYVTWRLMCEHADRFASIAPGAGGSAPGGDCMGVDEVSCPFDASMPGGMPSRQVPVLALMGRLDQAVPLACTTRIRDQAIATWGLGGVQLLDGDDKYAHNHWGPGNGNGLIETFEHGYETADPGPESSFLGHCIPGSTFDPQAPQYAIACAPPDAFTWGAQVMRFFIRTGSGITE